MNNEDTLKIVDDALKAVKLMNRKWQGLDMQEIGELSWKAEEQLIRDGLPMGEYAFEFYDLIETALKEKNHASNT